MRKSIDEINCFIAALLCVTMQQVIKCDFN